MKKSIKFSLLTNYLFLLLVLLSTSQSCEQASAQDENQSVKKEAKVHGGKPEYFLLWPEVEKAYGYFHAVKIGNHITVSGAVSMDDAGSPTAIGDQDQQMKNCYSDLEKVLKHYACTFDDVYMENIFTTDMPKFLELSVYWNGVYKKQFPTGSWVGVKELALPEFMIEIELEVYKVEWIQALKINHYEKSRHHWWLRFHRKLQRQKVFSRRLSGKSARNGYFQKEKYEHLKALPNAENLEIAPLNVEDKMQSVVILVVISCENKQKESSKPLDKSIGNKNKENGKYLETLTYKNRTYNSTNMQVGVSCFVGQESGKYLKYALGEIILVMIGI
jgi:2-iminobutanoate/2-iminopropanoate deaminase